MWSVLLVIALIGLFSPNVANANTTSRRVSPTDVREVNVSDSIQRFRDAYEEAKQQREETLAEFRLRQQEAKEELAQNREELRARISQIQDERKQKVVENLATRFSSVNEKWTTHWNNVLGRLTEILAKLESRAPDTDTSAAEAAIATAQNAVNEQAAKVYEIEFNSEEELGPQIRALIAEFKEDLRTTQTVVKEARDAVIAVLREFKAEGGSDEE